MVKFVIKDDILHDMVPILSSVIGVYLYGSLAEGRADERSDIDICLVAGPDSDPVRLQSLAWKKIRKEYDIRIFELFPLHMQIRILSLGILLYSRDSSELGEYMYPYWRRWDDQRWYQTPIPGAPGYIQ